MKNFLFPMPPSSRAYSLFLLALRILFGLLLIGHGIEKFAHYNALCFTFPDPIGYGKDLALMIVIFVEICCGIAFILGVLYRIVMIPMIIVLGTAFFYVHNGDLATGELALCYLLLFVLMYVAGPGAYAVDAIIYNYINRDMDEDDY